MFVNGSGSIILVLTAYDPVHWRVHATGGARIEQVLLFGHETQTIEGQTADTQVYTSPQGSQGETGHTYRRNDPSFNALARTVRELTGKEISTFQGQYESGSFHVAVGPTPASATSGPNSGIRRWVDANGVVHYEDARLAPTQPQ